MSVIWVKRHELSVRPYDPEGVYAFELLPPGKPLRARITQPRNARMLALYWSVVARVARGIGRSTEALDRYLRVASGHCDIYKTEKYGEIRVPRPINFEECEDEAEFIAFFDSAIVVIYGELGIEPAAIADLVDRKDRL